LLSFGHYDRNEPHTEAFVRRIFSIINNIIIQRSSIAIQS